MRLDDQIIILLIYLNPRTYYLDVNQTHKIQPTFKTRYQSIFIHKNSQFKDYIPFPFEIQISNCSTFFLLQIANFYPPQNCKVCRCPTKSGFKTSHTCGNYVVERERVAPWRRQKMVRRAASMGGVRRRKTERFWSVESSGDKPRLSPEPHPLCSSARSSLPSPIRQQSLYGVCFRMLSLILIPLLSSFSSYNCSTLLRNVWIRKQEHRKRRLRIRVLYWPCESGAREVGEGLEASWAFGWSDCDCDWRSWMKDLSSSFRYSKRSGWRSWSASNSSFACSSIILFLPLPHSKLDILDFSPSVSRPPWKWKWKGSGRRTEKAESLFVCFVGSFCRISWVFGVIEEIIFNYYVFSICAFFFTDFIGAPIGNIRSALAPLANLNHEPVSFLRGWSGS